MEKRMFTQHQQYIIISYFFFMFSYFSSRYLITDLDLISIRPNFYGLKNFSSNIVNVPLIFKNRGVILSQ